MIGESLDISYITRYGFSGKYNLIVNAESETNVYLDYDAYTARNENAFVGVIIICSIFETVFLSFFVLCIIFNLKDLKSFFKNKKSKKE